MDFKTEICRFVILLFCCFSCLRLCLDPFVLVVLVVVVVVLLVLVLVLALVLVLVLVLDLVLLFLSHPENFAHLFVHFSTHQQ